MQLKSRKTYFKKSLLLQVPCIFFFNLYAVTQRQLLMFLLNVVDAALEPQSQPQPMFGALLWEYSVRAGL